MTDQHPTIEVVDPATLLVDRNVRSDAGLDKDFLESIRDLGVLVPIVAVRTEDGLRVRYGHRRTLAAIEVGRDTVPVLVAGDEDADEAARIITQWAENEHRAGLTTADKVTAIEQLSLLGLPAAAIAKRTRAPKADVQQALATAGSALAKGATSRYQFLTLEQSAAVAEFDSDPDAVKALIAGAKDGEGKFAHVLQRARDERQTAERIAEARKELAEASVREIDRPGYDDRRTTADLDMLVNDKGKNITPGRHKSCPGHAAYIAHDWRGIHIVYVCTQYAKAGHRDKYNRQGQPATAPLSDEDKQARRQVIENNKAWRSAETVRRSWLKQFLARKTAPKGASTYLAGELGRGIHEIRRGMERSHHTATELLGLTRSPGDRDVIPAATAAATDARALVIALGVVLGDIEESTGTHTWRNPSNTMRRYFAFLAANGYTLSEVEKIAAGTTATEDKPEPEPS